MKKNKSGFQKGKKYTLINDRLGNQEIIYLGEDITYSFHGKFKNNNGNKGYEKFVYRDSSSSEVPIVVALEESTFVLNGNTITTIDPTIISYQGFPKYYISRNKSIERERLNLIKILEGAGE